MKAYNLKPQLFKASFGDLLCLQLGEQGRGRMLTLVPCPAEFADGEPVSLTTTQSGKPRIAIGDDGNPQWLARISTSGSYILNASGTVRSLAPGQARMIAEGWGAFGEAGRIGSWEDVLVVVEVGAVLRVKPSRGDAHFLHFLADKVVRIEREELDVYDVAIPYDFENYHAIEK